MDIQLFLPIITSSIEFAGKVLSAHIGKPFQPKDSSVKSPEKEKLVSYEFDKKFLESAIENSTQNFNKLLEVSSKAIIEEMKKERTKDAVQEVQANVTSLKQLLQIEIIDEKIAIQLIVGALNPLQVSLEKARLRLLDYGYDEIWQYCFIIGTSTLLAGYAYLGQDIPQLRNELQSIILKSQISVLNEIALIIIPNQKTFPWEKVPHLLTPQGVDELVNLYEDVAPKEIEPDWLSSLTEPNNIPDWVSQARANEPTPKPNTSGTRIPDGKVFPTLRKKSDK